jgi:dihydroneopterin aldolase
MRFHVLVGILPHEREFAQPLEVDLTVWRRIGAGAALDYRVLYAMAERMATERPIGFLEDAALALVREALRLDGVERARAALRKPNVALPGPLAHAEVVVDRLKTDPR